MYIVVRRERRPAGTACDARTPDTEAAPSEAATCARSLTTHRRRPYAQLSQLYQPSAHRSLPSNRANSAAALRRGCRHLLRPRRERVAPIPPRRPSWRSTTSRADGSRSGMTWTPPPTCRRACAGKSCASRLTTTRKAAPADSDWFLMKRRACDALVPWRWHRATVRVLLWSDIEGKRTMREFPGIVHGAFGIYRDGWVTPFHLVHPATGSRRAAGVTEGGRRRGMGEPFAGALFGTFGIFGRVRQGSPVCSVVMRPPRDSAFGPGCRRASRFPTPTAGPPALLSNSAQKTTGATRHQVNFRPPNRSGPPDGSGESLTSRRSLTTHRRDIPMRSSPDPTSRPPVDLSRVTERTRRQLYDAVADVFLDQEEQLPHLQPRGSRARRPPFRRPMVRRLLERPGRRRRPAGGRASAGKSCASRLTTTRKAAPAGSGWCSMKPEPGALSKFPRSRYAPHTSRPSAGRRRRS